ncbi:MAG: Hemagglutinin-related protein [Parcubacteria group bacterium GW2011_GWA2_56_7]|nr:MAG: Hemagglutinin-related protein [Parcubacteria group bacterium GW2011_GWA2_56_7]
MKPSSLLITAFVGFIITFSPSQALAFNPNFLISDTEFTDRFALDVGQIYSILQRGMLGSFVTPDIDGRVRHAADIIWRAGQRNGISPKVILTMLQKEQSLIEDPEPATSQFDWAMGYGVCDACTHETPEIQRWRGFAKQINSATLQLAEGYLGDLLTVGQTVAGFSPGKPSRVDDEVVVPANNATAALYTYTPHLHGNQNFVNIFQRYFAERHPTGTLLQDAVTGGVYVIKSGKKHAITSRAALLSRYHPDRVIQTDPSTLASYQDGLAISFPNYSILRTHTTTYLLVDDVLRPFDSEETKRSLGFVPDEELEVKEEELAGYEIGEPITQETSYPNGVVFQLTNTDAYYYVEDGVRHPVVTEDILRERYAGKTIHRVEPVRVESFKPGGPAKLPDGVLVRTHEDPTVFIITEGTRRAVVDEKTFTEMGWDWEDILVVHEDTLLVHPLSVPFNLSDDESQTSTASHE